MPSFFLHIFYETDPARPASEKRAKPAPLSSDNVGGQSATKKKGGWRKSAPRIINIMDFEDYLNGYENALKMPHEAFHAYCMNMRKAAPMDERISLQINYRCLLLAAELHEKKEIRKRNEK